MGEGGGGEGEGPQRLRLPEAGGALPWGRLGVWDGPPEKEAPDAAGLGVLLWPALGAGPGGGGEGFPMGRRGSGGDRQDLEQGFLTWGLRPWL